MYKGYTLDKLPKAICEVQTLSWFQAAWVTQLKMYKKIYQEFVRVK